MPEEAVADKRFGCGHDGPDDRGNCYGYEAEHPDYDGENYVCEKCGAPLTSEDN
jgi:hypothetical protein